MAVIFMLLRALSFVGLLNGCHVYASERVLHFYLKSFVILLNDCHFHPSESLFESRLILLFYAIRVYVKLE